MANLSLHVLRGAEKHQVRLKPGIQTVGSGPDVDISVPGVQSAWLLVHAHAQHIEVHEVASGTRTRFSLGESRTIAGALLTLELEKAQAAAFSLRVLTDALVDAVDVPSSLELLAIHMQQSAHADEVALLLQRVDGTYECVSRGQSKRPGLDSGEWISDTIVKRALDSTTVVDIDDASADRELKHLPSVTALRLRAVLCVPLAAQGHNVGAAFLARNRVDRPFSQREKDELTLTLALATPLLFHLRRAPALAAHRGVDSEVHPLMRTLAAQTTKLAASNLGVLIRGETGAGKERVAEALHKQSARRLGPFVVVNCAAIAEELAEAEFFGARKGSYTGANSDRIGLLERANHGTLFLDEVGEMPLPMQASLLRALETKEFLRVGDTTSRRSDFRIVAATHRDLAARVVEGCFRQDLLYRLQEAVLTVPPLRQRPSDILALAESFRVDSEREGRRGVTTFAQDAIDALSRHSWPGNVRELRSVVRRAVLLCEGSTIRASDLSLAVPALAAASAVERLEVAKEAFVRDHVARALANASGNRELAAAQLGISLRSLYRYLA